MLSSSDNRRRTELFFLWTFGVVIVSIACIVLIPDGERFPAAFVGAAVYALVAWGLPEFRIRMDCPICPLNWAHCVFILQLIVLPLSLFIFSPRPGRLPFLPTDFAINVAIVISAIAFVSFAAGYTFLARRMAPSPDGKREGAWPEPPLFVIVAFAGMGIIGFILTFHDLSTFIDYFSSPVTGLIILASSAGTWSGFLGQILRTFFGFSVILAWCRWIERSRERRHWSWLALGTAPFFVLVFLIFGTFGLNRAAFTIPLVAMTGVYSKNVKRVPFKVLALLAAIMLGLLFFLGAFRMQRYTTIEVIQEAGVRTDIMEQVDLVSEVQVYGFAPQFAGFFMEEAGWGKQLLLGKSIVASILSPIPIFGKSFRDTCGTALYNKLIYGELDISDQVAPFQGEIFLNFHLPGVIFAYLLIGLLVCHLQLRFDAATDPASSYIWLVVSYWIAFLVQGSLTVVSQIFIYSFWPYYLYLVTGWLWRKARNAGEPAVAI